MVYFFSQQDDLVHPVKAIVKYINTFFPGQPCLSLSSSTFNETLKQNGVNVKTKVVFSFRIKTEQFLITHIICSIRPPIYNSKICLNS